MPSFGYYSSSSFLNVVYAMDIAIENHFAKMLFESDLSRIIYSSNALSMRKRARGKSWSDSLLPFMNYRMTGIRKGIQDDRGWGSYLVNTGFPIEEIGRRIKVSPVTVSYESTLWFHQPLDTMIANERVIWEAHLEKFIPFSITISSEDGESQADLSLKGRILYDETYNPEYTDKDWLEQNKIESIALNFEMETLSLQYGGEIVVPETVVFSFTAKKGDDVTLAEYFSE